MTRTKSSRALVSVVLAVLMAVAFMPAISYTSFAATAKKATKVTKVYHKANTTYTRTVGSAWTLKYKLSPSKLTTAAKKVVWKSSNKSVVSVSAKSGNKAAVSFKKAGTATVTVYTKANKKAKTSWKFKVVNKTTKKTTTLTGVTVSAPNGANISSSVAVGTTLKAIVAPADAENVTYQWYADGTAIDGATDNTFTTTAAESGKAITVKATSKNTVESEKTAKVNTQTLNAVSVKSVDSTGATTDVTSNSKLYVGDTLKAVATGTEGSNNASATINDVTYQWYRTVNGTTTAISGATDQTYTLADADKNATIFVVATPKTGVEGYAAKSGETPAVQATTSATLSIKVEEGNLTAEALTSDGKTAVTPAPTYQWASSTDGSTFTAIANTNNAVFNNPVAGTTYKVTITPAAGQKFASTTATVKYTGKFLSDYTLADIVDTTKAGQNAVGDTLTVKNLTGLTYGTDYTTTWYRAANGTTTLDTLTAKNLGTAQNYTLTSSDADSVIFAVVNGAGDFAGQSATYKVTAAAASASTTVTLNYSNNAFTLTKGTASESTAGYALYRVKNSDLSNTSGITVEKVDGFTNVTTSNAEGWTYFAVPTTGKKVATNGIEFVTGSTTPTTNVSISDYVMDAVSKLPTA